jgi:hypothetical protein
LAAAIRLQFRLCVKVRIFRAIGVPAGGCRLTLLEAGKTALRIAPSVPASTGVQIESRQAASLPVNSRSRVGAGSVVFRALKIESDVRSAAPLFSRAVGINMTPMLEAS